MSLDRYTTDELIDELKKRDVDVIIANRNVEFHYATGVVISKILGYKILIDEEDALKYGISRKCDSEIKIMTGVFNSRNRPKVGDRVRMKCRKTKSCPKFNPYNARIFEVIKDE